VENESITFLGHLKKTACAVFKLMALSS